MSEETVVAAAATAAEQTAASAEDTNATESATGEQQEPTTEGEQKPRGGFQRRIDTLTRKNADAEREAGFWREQALKSRPSTAAVETPKETSKPDGKDFATHAEYVEALTDWKVDTRFKTEETKQNAEKTRTQQSKVEQTYRGKEQEYKAAVPDFDEVMADADFPVSAAVVDEIQTGDNGPALKYYLAKNPDEAARLSKLTPFALAREVGRLESRFTTAPQKTAATVSKAPAPPNVGGRSSSTSTKSIYDDLSPEDYRALRRKMNAN